jgi:excisionase family DNA binding protein
VTLGSPAALRRRWGGVGSDLNCRQAAAILGLSIGTVRLHADQGKLTHRRTAGGHRRFAATDLEGSR